MSMYFAKGIASTAESRHYKKNADGVSKHDQAWQSTMPNGFSAFPQSRFPSDQPPTLFHPASPKLKATKEVDAASMASTSTFASTVSLLKENVKARFSSKQRTSSPEYKAPSPRAQTTEAYRTMTEKK